MIVSLQYGHFENSSIFWDSSLNFKALKYLENPITTRVKGLDLQQIAYNHLMSKKNSYQIIIGADELAGSSLKFEFIENLYCGGAWLLSIDNWATSVQVDLDDAGKMPKDL